jgi:hypothetical protein
MKLVALTAEDKRQYCELNSARGVRRSAKPAQPISADVESPKGVLKPTPSAYIDLKKTEFDLCSDGPRSNFFVDQVSPL